MKKLITFLAIVAAVSSASALEIGVHAGKNYAYDDNSAGVSLTKHWDKVSGEVSFDRVVTGTPSDRYSVVAGYDLAQFAGFTVTPKVGGAFLKPSVGPNGYAGLVGVGVSYPLTAKVKLGVDYNYQVGQDRTQKLDGSALTASVKYSF